MNYLIADFVTRLKNASQAKRRETLVPYSSLNKAVAALLQNLRFVTETKEEEVEGKRMLRVGIAYEKRVPVLQGVTVISKPSLRVYKKATDQKRKGNRNIRVLSTSQGIMTAYEATKKGIGGELLFEIW